VSKKIKIFSPFKDEMVFEAAAGRPAGRRQISLRGRAQAANCWSRGGIRTNVVEDALKAGVGILVVGRAITASKDVGHATNEFL
jgi:thiamine monophosphate synthase